MEGDNQFFDDKNDIELEDDAYFIPEKKPKVSKRERILAIAVVVTIFFGLVAMYMSLAGLGKMDWGKSDQSSAPVLDDETLEAIELQKKDSDSDGLSDYDEINVYYTSPYLEDSDSDGKTDFEEIEANTDPNCVGSSCQIPVPVVDINYDDPSDVVDDLGGGTVPLDDLEIDSVMDLQKLTGAQIRAMLLEQGVPEAVINQIKDQDLKDLFLDQLASELEPQ